MYRYQIGPSAAQMFKDGRDSDRSNSAHLDLEVRLKELSHQVDRLMLINMTLWSFIQEKHGISDKELVARMREIDLMDGTADGKMKRATTICLECGRTTSVKTRKCMYCGAELPPDTPFDLVP